MILCCNGCGRDVSVPARSYRAERDYYCRKCMGQGVARTDDRRGRKTLNMSEAVHEDRYDETRDAESAEEA